MDFRIPFSILHVASQANQLYSNAMYLKESIRTYEQTCQKVTNINDDDIIQYVIDC